MAIELHKNPHNKLLDDNCGIYVSWQCFPWAIHEKKGTKMLYL